MTDLDLAVETCTPCKEGGTPLGEDAISELHSQVPEWEVVEREGIKRLERDLSFPDFVQALAFTNAVGEMAEEQDHHPKIVLEWGRVTVTWWTHKIGGLHRNDFIAAAKTDRIYQGSD
ncbi:MAG: 4a-hydroxytetrahydrobiopterin dehydratase [Anaerolineae bacterium]